MLKTLLLETAEQFCSVELASYRRLKPILKYGQETRLRRVFETSADIALPYGAWHKIAELPTGSYAAVTLVCRRKPQLLTHVFADKAQICGESENGRLSLPVTVVDGYLNAVVNL